MAILSVVAIGSYAQTTLWEEDWQSTEKGKLVNEVTNANAVYTLSTTNASPFTKIYENTNDASNLELLLPKTDRGESWTAEINLNGASGNLTLTFSYNKSTINITSETAGVTVSDVSNTGALINVPAGTSTLKLTFSNPMSQNARLDNLKLVSGGTEEVYTEVGSFGRLSGIESGTKVNLTFSNAQVLFAYNNDMYVQDATGAIDIYGCNLPYTAGQKLNGKATVKYELFKGHTPEITSVSNAELTATDGEVTPTVYETCDAITKDKVNTLVKLTGTVTLDNGGTRTNYYLVDDEENQLLFYSKWGDLEGTDLSGLKEGDQATITGIVVNQGTAAAPEMAIAVTKAEYDNVPVTPEVTSFAELKELGDGAEAEITLTDAVVTFVNGNDMFVTDATGSMDFYRCNLPYTAGQVLNGTATVKFSVYKKVPEITSVKNSTITATDGEATPKEVSIASINDDMACDFIKISGTVSIEVPEATNGIKTASTNYYLVDDSNNKVLIYQKWKSVEGTDLSVLKDGDKATINGIVEFYNDDIEIYVTKLETTSTGIDGVAADALDENAPIFNLAGQRVEKAVKGVYIQNGKKFIVK